MLVFNTIRLYSLLSWSYSFLDSGDQSIEDQVSSSANLYQIETIINSAVFIQALIYSLMLLALYIPTKYYISKAVKTWNEDGLISKESDSTNEKIKNLTSFSFSNNFTSYFAIVGPLLSGPAIDLLTQIISFI